MDFNEAKQILNKNSNKYNDTEIQDILDLLQVFVENDLRRFYDEESNTIY